MAKNNFFWQLVRGLKCFFFIFVDFLTFNAKKIQKKVFWHLVPELNTRKSTKIKKHLRSRTKCQKSFFWHLVRGTKNEALRLLFQSKKNYLKQKINPVITSRFEFCLNTL